MQVPQMHWLAWKLPLSADQLSCSARAVIEAHGWWALRFTPEVAVLDEALLLNVASTERLWGGIAALRRLLLTHMPQSQTDADEHADARLQWAEGVTALQALALLRAKQEQGKKIRLARVPDDLPMSTLTALRPHLGTLNNLGCRTLGDVRALPRAGVARRLGAQCLLALDQLWGERSFPLTWISLPEHFDLELELPYIASTSADLMHAAEHLLEMLQMWLRARHRGVLRLVLRWRHDLRRLDGVELEPWGQLELRTAEPLQELSHLRRLLAEQMAHRQLAAPANRLALRTLESASLQQTNASLLPKMAGEEREGEPWHQFVERVSARLGEQCLRVPQRHADHRPENMQHWHSAASLMLQRTKPDASALPLDARASLWPAWLLPAPQLLSTRQHKPYYMGQVLQLCAGPQRFEGSWWEGAAPPEESKDSGLLARDYYVAHNAAAGWVWVFSDKRSGDWYLHGVYG